jgi:hypothetical protein
MTRFLAWMVLLAWLAVPVSAAPLRMVLEEDAVVISGVTAKGRVALLGVTREIGEDEYPTARRHLEVLADEDGDGVVRYPVEGGVPLRSLFAAVDLASGDFETVSPAALGLRRVNWRGRGPGQRSGGKDSVEDRRRLLELLVVRPNVGVWAARIKDGDESDADGAIDGRVEGLLEGLSPLGDGPEAPSVFQRDDVVLALDPTVLEITLVKVAD